MTEQYAAYLESAEWQLKRAARLKLSKGRCSVPRCRRSKVIHVHHLTYARVFNEDMADLLPLCVDHHGLAEKLIAAGKLNRHGNVAFLASETLRLMSPSKKPTRSSRRKLSKKPFRARLMENPAFVRLLSLRSRHEFKIATRKMFGGSSAVMGIACAIYDHPPRRHGRYSPPNDHGDLKRASGARRLRGLYR